MHWLRFAGVECAGEYENSVTDRLKTYDDTKAEVFKVLDELAHDEYLMKLNLIDQQEQALKSLEWAVTGRYIEEYE